MTAPVPSQTRAAVLRRANGRCEDCGEQRPLELHHLRYDEGPPVYFDIAGRETPDDLDALCRDCHHARHVDPNGDYWRDPQEMAEHWESWHHEMGKP